MQKNLIKIIIDSREQKPFTFQGYEAIIEPGTLATGDYSLKGLTDRIAIERKSLDDLVQCLSWQRERFSRELERARAYDFFAVVIEASWQDLAQGRYRSKMTPKSASQSVMAFMARYAIPFFFAGNRKTAEFVCYSLLEQYLAGERKRLEAILTV